MNSPSASRIESRRNGRGARPLVACQSGAFSPFMFGLVMGVTIFSAVSMQVARQNLADLQTRQQERGRAQAQEMADALDFAILSETRDTYREDYDVNRVRGYAGTTAKTRGDQNVLITARQDGERQSFGRTAEKVAFTVTDDVLLRSKVAGIEDARQLSEMSARTDQPMAVYDTSSARDRQIRTSNSRMESLAEQIYAHYAANLRFPDSSEFETIRRSFNLRDAWGKEFEYDISASGQDASLSFTTPWGYRRALNLSLKDGAESAQ